MVLLLLKTLYSLKQAAMAFWRELLKVMIDMNMERSQVDPCLYFAWTDHGLVIWVSWINDCLVVGEKKAVLIAKKQMIDIFDCEEV